MTTVRDTAMKAGLRYGYITNGLADHRLDDALAFLADCGYDGVGLTLDHHHLDPFGRDVRAQVDAVSRRLQDLGLAVVIETGARFLLDPRRKHEPTLLSEGRELRISLLRRAIAIAADIGAPVVSFWSGVVPAGLDPDEAWNRLAAGCEEVIIEAQARGVTLGLEPEPGMLVERIDDWERLAAHLGQPGGLGLTLDIGHCQCLETEPIDECVRRVGRERLVHVQIEDMRRGVHEHLDFGDGEIDFPPVLSALAEIGYRGLVCVELSRHSHTAHTTVPRAITFLRQAERKERGDGVSGVSLALLTGALRRHMDSRAASWLDDALAAVESDASAVRTWFPAAARKVGTASLDVRDHDGGEPWSADEAARATLLAALGAGVTEEIDDLYRYGDAAERRAILRSLHLLPVGDGSTALVLDALRTNDERLVAASLGPYAIDHLDDSSLRQAVLKCVFMGIPLARIPDLETRADPELARMLAAYAHERVAAGRDVPNDVWPWIDRFPPEAELAALADELHANAHARRRAAAAALAQHDAIRRRN